MVEEIIRHFRSNSFGILTGAAGTGKTHTITNIVNSWPNSSENVLCLAPTARAVQRLVEVTGHPAQTVHSAIFVRPLEDDLGNPLFKWTKKVGGPSWLIIVDEASMVGQRLLEKIRTALLPGSKLLLVGDPNQLQPVLDKPVDYSKPDFHLQKVWRNDGGVLAFAHAVLACETPQELRKLIKNPVFPNVHLRAIHELPPSKWKYDSLRENTSTLLLSYTNDLRHKINQAVRTRLGYSSEQPMVPGEKFIVRSNHQDIGVVNGEYLDYVQPVETVDPDLPEHYREMLFTKEFTGESTQGLAIPGELTANSVEFRKLLKENSTAWKARCYREFPQSPKWKPEAQLIRTNSEPDGLVGPAREAIHLNYSYGVTTHVAQGSECAHVGVVHDADWLINRDFRNARALHYTAVTRAQKSVTYWVL